MSGRLHAPATLPLGRDACTRVIGRWGFRTPGVVRMFCRGMDTALLQTDRHTAVCVCSIKITTKITGAYSVLAENAKQFATNLPTKPFTFAPSLNCRLLLQTWRHVTVVVCCSPAACCGETPAVGHNWRSITGLTL